MLIPGLWIIRQIARYKSGMPLITMVTHAGSNGEKRNLHWNTAKFLHEMRDYIQQKKYASHNRHGKPCQKVIESL